MIWGPRQFGSYMSDRIVRDPDQILLYLSQAAAERIHSVARSGELKPSPRALPASRLVIGLENPIHLENGLSTSMLWVNGIRDAQAVVGIVGATRVFDPSRFLPPPGISVLWCRDRLGNVVGHASIELDSIELDSTNPSILTPTDRFLEFKEEPTLTGDEKQLLSSLIRGAWTLYLEPPDAVNTGTAVKRQSFIVGRTEKKGKYRRQDVSIIEVRRRPEPDRSTEPSEASDDLRRASTSRDFRWKVRGHRRMQPYGPGRSLRRPIWVEGYLAGPEDKPVRSQVARIH